MLYECHALGREGSPWQVVRDRLGREWLVRPAPARHTTAAARISRDLGGNDAPRLDEATDLAELANKLGDEAPREVSVHAS